MKVAPDTILYNGRIHTMRSPHDIVEAIAIKEDRIIAIGGNQEVRRLSSSKTREIDLGGKSVLPGLIDTHTHLETVAEGLININLKGARSIDEVLKIIEENVPKKPDQWVLSSFWHPFAQLREKRLPTRFDLDKVCPHNPVLLLTVGHIAIANSRALEMAGMEKWIPALNREELGCDPETGQPNGVLKEKAIHLVRRLIPPHNENDLEAKYEEVINSYNKSGITSIITGSTTQQDLKIWKKLHAKSHKNLRVNLALLPTGEEAPRAAEQEFQSALNEITRSAPAGDSFLSFGFIKFVLDGGMTLKTAAVTEPYPDGGCGVLTIEQKRLNGLVNLCHRSNFRVGIHAVGDSAIDSVLEAYEQADQNKFIGGKRFILIHGFLIRPDQIRRVSQLGILVATQNVFMYEKAEVTARFLGEVRANSAIPTRSLLNGGIVVTGGSDADVNSFNPFWGIYQAVTRKSKEGQVFGPDEKIGRWEALCMYTKWAALQTFEEGLKGVLAPGKFADLIVTAADIFTCPEEAIKEIEVLLTMVGGKIVHADNQFR